MTLALGAADTIRGVAGSATSITYTIFGDAVASGADGFDVLAQGQLPASIGTLYTVPASTIAIVKSIHLANPTGSDVTAQLNVNGTAGANVILPPVTILAGGFAVYGSDGWKFYNSQGQLLGVGATGATGATGADGADGVGVPAGGTEGQRLAKIDGTDYNTEWVSPGAATVDVQEGGSSVVAAAGALNFDASDFDVTDEGGGVAGIALASPGGGGGGNDQSYPYPGSLSGDSTHFAATTGWSDVGTDAFGALEILNSSVLHLKTIGNKSSVLRHTLSTPFTGVFDVRTLISLGGTLVSSNDDTLHTFALNRADGIGVARILLGSRVNGSEIVYKMRIYWNNGSSAGVHLPWPHAGQGITLRITRDASNNLGWFVGLGERPLGLIPLVNDSSRVPLTGSSALQVDRIEYQIATVNQAGAGEAHMFVDYFESV
jgi:hypothetical protein